MIEERKRNPGPDLADGVAFITGGASGIGLACARRFVAAGSAVVLADLNADGGAAVERELREGGARATFVTCNVADPDSVAAAIAAAVDEHGRIDFAVNSAGVPGTPSSAPLAEMSIEAFDRIVAVNLRGVFLCTRAELGVMAAQGSGSIVNLSSGAGLVGVPRSAAYTAAKHGVIGISKVAALDYADVGIRVNAVCPGMVRTPLVANGMPEELRQAVLDAHPMHRLAEPEEIAEAIMWLCSPAATYTTGVALPVDGGFVAR